MSEQYNHKKIEARWQKIWEEKRAFQPLPAEDRRKKRYVLDMFPYPSGAGLHVGHPEGYTATDIYCRYLRMNGFNVLHPMGWDAFGLPAENYAIKSGVHPAQSTRENIKTFRRQIKSLGFSYDWSREVNTSDPDYYRWTQWLFLQFYKNGLAYKKAAPVNWCPSCQTVLANEQVVDGKCERCGHSVTQKNLEQWFFKITGTDPLGKNDSYPERLLKNLDKLDWPDPIKTMQRNWIGRSEGALLKFRVASFKLRDEKEIEVFTTRPDTLYGATYMVLAPEHPLVRELKDKIRNWPEVEKYIKKTAGKSQLERTDLAKEKTGVCLQGVMAVNPGNEQEIPIWIADYVLMGYGTGAIMAVPGHDERDWEFAKKYALEIKAVIMNKDRELYHIGSTKLSDKQVFDKLAYFTQSIIDQGPILSTGILIQSSEFDGMDSEEAKWKITEKAGGRKQVQYKLRDWLISRQRYWGAPIPIIYCRKCWETIDKKQLTTDGQMPAPSNDLGSNVKCQMFTEIDGENYAMIPVPDKDLPVVLPNDVDFRPHGESPLARSKSFHKVNCPKCGEPARRESDTMDTFVDSSWYFLRYTDPQNKKEFASAEELQKWLPVDTYVGGAEHAVLHLMYARWFCMVLYDLGYLDFPEPFLKLRNQGLILGPDGQKMSKSRGNVINPDEVIENLGADTMRMYEMFMGPLEDAKPWDTNGIIGVRRFLERVWRMREIISSKFKVQSSKKIIERGLHQLIKKVSEDIESFGFNTAVSQFMIFVNLVYQAGAIASEDWLKFLRVLYPFAPHLSQELWSLSGKKTLLEQESWPAFDAKLLREEEKSFVIQINGKVRGTVIARPDIEEAELAALASKDEKVAKHLAGKQVVKRIFVEGRLLNIVVE